MPLWAFLAHIRPLFLRCIETEIDSLASAIDEQSAERPSRHIRFIKGINARPRAANRDRYVILERVERVDRHDAIFIA